jgi:ribonuclease HII
MPRQKFDLSTLPDRPDLSFEHELWERGVVRVAGVDEAGRGPLAGPVSAGVVILPPNPLLTEILCGVRDSKQMTPEERETWAVCIRQSCLAWAVGFASHQEIDNFGIVPATRLAVARALEQLTLPPGYLLVDFLHLPDIPIPQTPLIKGDARSLSIASASVLAKTTRDAWMREIDAQYPGYGFAIHKGYCTPQHLNALDKLGPCSIHRMSFDPIRSWSEVAMK